MESRPHHPRPRPDHLRPRPPLPRPRPNIFLVEYFPTKKHIIFSLGIFFYKTNIIFSQGYWNLPPTECFFHASILIFLFFRSCGLDRVVSSETFELRDRDLHHCIVDTKSLFVVFCKSFMFYVCIACD